MRFSEIVEDANEASGIRMWHGGRWDGPPTIQSPRKGRYEVGPGIYLNSGDQEAESLERWAESQFPKAVRT